jgi:hypothetical protein
MSLATRRSLALTRALAARCAPAPLGARSSAALRCAGAPPPPLLAQAATRGAAAAAHAPRFLYHAAVYLMLERGDELLMARAHATPLPCLLSH